MPQPAIHEKHKIPDTLNVALIILAGKVDLIPNNPLGRDAFVGAALAATDRTVDGVAIAAKAAPTKTMLQLDGR